jgi:CRISPR/Cas system CSM-associated protein Csm3 (group 7 of RAMP superfamily)
MNPYDFARIDWDRPPERRAPIWHHQLTSRNGQPLYSGHLDVDVITETPLFIHDPRNDPGDENQAALSMQNQAGDFIIPGSSLKGMLRSVVEALGNGCLTLFDGTYGHGQDRIDYWSKLPAQFQHCNNNSQLCIACRIFGMLHQRSSGVFLGKVNIGDAVAKQNDAYLYDPMYTAVLVEPKPRHQAFYLEEPAAPGAQPAHIAGRKFYFHHSPKLRPLSAPRLIYFGGKPANRYIQPLDYGTVFHFRLDFTALEADELGVLLFAIALDENTRHKIGYGKPLGLGSISLEPKGLTKVDYSTRYSSAAAERGKTEYQGDAMWNEFYGHMEDFEKNHLVSIALDDVRRIWQWEPDPKADYRYPDRAWFNTPGNSRKRIRDTP